MLIRTTRSQVGFLLRQKEAILTFCVLMLLVLANFVENCQMFQGQDMVKLAHTTKMGLLSWNRASYAGDLALLFQQIYPLLVVIPAGFVLAKERGTQEHVLMITRMGSSTYYFSKLLSTFVVTAVVFTLPFLLETLLHVIAFSAKPAGDLVYGDAYEEEYIAVVRQYLFSNLFVRSPYLYAVVKMLIFGLFSGLMGAFSVAVSALYRVKYRITVLLPSFLLLNLSAYAPMLLRKKTASYVWYTFLMLHEEEQKSFLVFFIALVLVALVTVGGTFWVSRRGQL